MPAFLRRQGNAQPETAIVDRILASSLQVHYGTLHFNAWPAKPLVVADLSIGDTISVRWDSNTAYATARLNRRIDRTPADTTTATIQRIVTETISGSAGTIDDEELVRRDGSHSLYVAASWVWEVGAEVAGTLRSWGYGLLQVFGSLYAGQREGGHAGIFEYPTETPGETSSLIQAVGNDNVPHFSMGVRHNGTSYGHFGAIGREGGPQIHFGPKTGQPFDVPLVDVELIDGTIPGVQVDTHTLTLSIYNSLGEVPSLVEGQLFCVRRGEDSIAFYIWSRWGPEGQSGYHVSGPHNHASFEEGDLLRAQDIPIVDMGDRFTAEDIENALQEIGINNHAILTLDGAVERLLTLVDQKLYLTPVVTGGMILAGSATGASGEPDFRQLVDSDVAQLHHSAFLSLDADDHTQYHTDTRGDARYVRLPSVVEQGDILYHNGSGWVCLSHGNAGQVLTSGGHGADPSWQDSS